MWCVFYFNFCIMHHLHHIVVIVFLLLILWLQLLLLFDPSLLLMAQLPTWIHRSSFHFPIHFIWSSHILVAQLNVPVVPINHIYYVQSSSQASTHLDPIWMSCQLQTYWIYSTCLVFYFFQKFLKNVHKSHLMCRTSSHESHSIWNSSKWDSSANSLNLIQTYLNFHLLKHPKPLL